MRSIFTWLTGTLFLNLCILRLAEPKLQVPITADVLKKAADIGRQRVGQLRIDEGQRFRLRNLISQYFLS